MNFLAASLSRAHRALISIIRPKVRHSMLVVMLATGIALTPDWAGQPSVSLAPQTIAAPAQLRGLSEIDAALYREIFAAQERGNIDAADHLLTQISDPVLLGYVLAQRYLGYAYTSTTDELSLWLANYADHPQASEIRALAAAKGTDVAEDHSLYLRAQRKPLKGDGYVLHLGRTTMPDGWYRGLSLWKAGNFNAAASRFVAIGNDQNANAWQRSAANFWAYRSYQRMGNPQAAADALALAANDPTTFYGLLARTTRGEAPLPAPLQAPEVTAELRNDAHVLRAEALTSIDRTDEAEHELRALYAELDDSTRVGLITLAAEMHLPNLQLRLAQLQGLDDTAKLFASYPAPQPMIDAQNVISPALVLAVARQESAFRSDVGSHAGATGMMQMMPATARAVLRHQGTELLSLADADDSMAPIAERLNDSTLSVKLGAAYLKLLTQEPAIGSNLMRMLAGYNAGPGTVANWQRGMARQMTDPLLYLESIPYPETHNYVMQVMAHYWIYQTMLGETPTTLQQLSKGIWPQIS